MRYVSGQKRVIPDATFIAPSISVSIEDKQCGLRTRFAVDCPININPNIIRIVALMRPILFFIGNFLSSLK